MRFLIFTFVMISWASSSLFYHHERTVSQFSSRTSILLARHYFTRETVPTMCFSGYEHNPLQTQGCFHSLALILHPLRMSRGSRFIGSQSETTRHLINNTLLHLIRIGSAVAVVRAVAHALAVAYRRQLPIKKN